MAVGNDLDLKLRLRLGERKSGILATRIHEIASFMNFVGISAAAIQWAGARRGGIPEEPVP